MHCNKFLIYTYIEKFDASFIINLPKKISLIYRNYENTNIEEILKIYKLCKKIKRKIFISNNIKLAIKLNTNGAYIPSFNNNLNIKYFKFKKNFELIGSAHTYKEIRIKKLQNINKIFLSPIFENEKTKKNLGIYKFLHLKRYAKSEVICLGGIKKQNLKKIKMIEPAGFASISLFR